MICDAQDVKNLGLIAKFKDCKTWERLYTILTHTVPMSHIYGSRWVLTLPVPHIYGGNFKKLQWPYFVDTFYTFILSCHWFSLFPTKPQQIIIALNQEWQRYFREMKEGWSQSGKPLQTLPRHSINNWSTLDSSNSLTNSLKC